MKVIKFISTMVTFLFIGFFAAPSTSAANFTDVPDDSPLKPIITTLSEFQIISGYPDGSFRPNEKMERQHVAALLTRAIPLKPKRPQRYFRDVLVTHRNFSDILALQRAGIIDGTSDGAFHPQAAITRAQMAKIIAEAFELKNSGQQHPFKDVSHEHWASSAISSLYANEITFGNSNGNFQPNGIVTRGEYVQFLHRALLKKDSGTIQKPTHLLPNKIKEYEVKQDKIYLHGITIGSTKQHVINYFGQPKQSKSITFKGMNGQTITEERLDYGIYTFVLLNEKIDHIITNRTKQWAMSEATNLHEGPIYADSSRTFYILTNPSVTQLLVAKAPPFEVVLTEVDGTFQNLVNNGYYKKIN